MQECFLLTLINRIKARRYGYTPKLFHTVKINFRPGTDLISLLILLLLFCQGDRLQKSLLRLHRFKSDHDAIWQDIVLI